MINGTVKLVGIHTVICPIPIQKTGAIVRADKNLLILRHMKGFYIYQIPTGYRPELLQLFSLYFINLNAVIRPAHI